MPERPGQLDEISQSIGRLEGKFDAVERYMHDREHGLNNLSQKVDALGSLITREIAAVEARIKIRIEQVEERLTMLEAAQNQQVGAKKLAAIVLQSPLIGWLFGIAVLVAAWWKGVPHK